MNTEALPKLKTNLDTDFLKLVAILSMVVDHTGSVFFPQYPVFRWIGRMAFPIFAYCLTVGMLYTHDIKKYLGRLGVFALVSQPFWILAFNSDDIWGNLFNLNIFFTLLVSLWTVWGFSQRKWWIFVAGLVITAVINLDYSYTGIILMLIFYLCRQRPALGAALYTASYLTALWGGYLEDPLALVVGGHPIGFEIFALLSLPLIFLRTHTGVKINKWFFYWFYPAHLLILFLLQLVVPAVG